MCAMPAMLPLIVAAMAVSAQAVVVFDVINITLVPVHWCQQLLHGQGLRTPQWLLVDQPQVVLPTVDEIKELSSNDTQERSHFFVSVMVILFIVTVILGTAVMVYGPSLRQSLRSHAHGSPRTAAIRTEYEPLAVHGAEGLSVSSQRGLVSVAFAGTALASAAACWFSIHTDRLNKSVGLDWEIYLLLFCFGCLSFLVQSVFAVRWLPAGKMFPITAFAEAAVPGLAPFISDYFDTLKDTIFAGLCFQSEHLELRGIGVFSWVYLLLIHVHFLTSENTLAELANCYLPVLLALPEPRVAPSADVEDCSVYRLIANGFAKLKSAFCFLLYKQCTPTKRRLLLIENVPQAFLSVIFLLVEGGSTFVLVINLTIPAAQVAATSFFKPLLSCVAPQLGKKLVGFLNKPDYLKAKQIWLEAAAGSFPSFPSEVLHIPTLQ